MEVLQFSSTECAISMCTVFFTGRPEEMFVAVGTAEDVSPTASNQQKCNILMYRLVLGRLQLLHTTPVQSPAHFMCDFQGRLLAAVGGNMQFFDLGKKKLLLKMEKKLPEFSRVMNVSIWADRLFVSEVTQSLLVLKYSRATDDLIVIARDCMVRYLSAFVVLDYDTVCGADKFGNIFTLSLRGNRTIENNLTGKEVANFSILNHYYLGESAKALSVAQFFPGKEQVLLVGSISGGLHMLTPLQSKRDVFFYSQLEGHARLRPSPP